MLSDAKAIHPILAEMEDEWSPAKEVPCTCTGTGWSELEFGLQPDWMDQVRIRIRSPNGTSSYSDCLFPDTVACPTEPDSCVSLAVNIAVPLGCVIGITTDWFCFCRDEKDKL
jgi:hypothetical protein